MKETLPERLWRGFWIYGVYIRFTWNANSRDVPFKYCQYKKGRETSHWFWRFNWETIK